MLFRSSPSHALGLRMIVPEALVNTQNSVEIATYQMVRSADRPS